MKLEYFNPKPSNFGDELNTLIWTKLLPDGFLDDNEAELFLGIGSILGDQWPKGARKHVLGSGFGGYSPPSVATGPDWNVVWVRGPLTAAAIGVDKTKAITDAAVLLRAVELPTAEVDVDVCFMPHFQSLDRGNWKAACEIAKVTFLDPSGDPADLISKIRGARLVISEAMHGAIVADALRTPWIGIRPFSRLHHPKWEDWSRSLDLEIHWGILPPSSMIESYIKYGRRVASGPRAKRFSDSFIARPFNNQLVQRAAEALGRLAETGAPQLSADSKIELATEQCRVALDRFCDKWRFGPPR